MEQNEFVKYLDDLFKTYGFTKKGNNWFSENDFLKKIINLQKSAYGNNYYVNYGFIIKSLPLNNLKTHIYTRLSSSNIKERQRISELLDFEKNINDSQRKEELRHYLQKNMIDEMQQINSENELLNQIKIKPYLNVVIPLIVKKHFNLS